MDPMIQKYLADKYKIELNDDEKIALDSSEQRANQMALSQGLTEAADTIAAGIANREKTRPIIAGNPYQSSNSVRDYIMNKLKDRRGAALEEADQMAKADLARSARAAKADEASDRKKDLTIKETTARNDRLDKNTMDMIKYRDSHDVTKQTNIIAPAFKKITTAARAGTAAGDMGVIFGYMKMQDPTSTVREGEYATAQNAAGIPERLRVAYNKAIDGQILGEEQRADFVARAKEMYDNQMAAQSAFDSQIQSEAKNRGIDPNRVIINPWSRQDDEQQTQKAKSKPVNVVRASSLPPVKK